MVVEGVTEDVLRGFAERALGILQPGQLLECKENGKAWDTNTAAAGENEAAFFAQSEESRGLSVIIEDPGSISQLFMGDEHSIHVQLPVKDPDGHPSTTKLSTDYMEVRVRYHHPEEESGGGANLDGGSGAGPDAGQDAGQDGGT